VYISLADDTQVLQHLVMSFTVVILSQTWCLTRVCCTYNVLQLRKYITQHGITFKQPCCTEKQYVIH